MLQEREDGLFVPFTPFNEELVSKFQLETGTTS